MDHLTTFVGECDRKTEAAKKRLAETQEELSAEVTAKLQKVIRLLYIISLPCGIVKSIENLGPRTGRANRSKTGQGRGTGS